MLAFKKMFGILSLSLLSFTSDAQTYSPDKDVLNKEGSDERERSFRQKEKTTSEKISEHIQKRQKINQEVLSLELEINLLRTRKNNMDEQDYQKKMRELSDKLRNLKYQPY